MNMLDILKSNFEFAVIVLIMYGVVAFLLVILLYFLIRRFNNIHTLLSIFESLFYKGEIVRIEWRESVWDVSGRKIGPELVAIGPKGRYEIYKGLRLMGELNLDFLFNKYTRGQIKQALRKFRKRHSEEPSFLEVSGVESEGSVRDPVPVSAFQNDNRKIA